MRRLLLLTAAATLSVAACGSSKSNTGAAATTAAKSTATTAASTATTKAPAATTAAGAATTVGAAAAGGVTVTLKEWSIDSPAITAGSVSLTVKNTGQNDHELEIIKADSYESLAKGQGGSIDEAKLDAGAIVAKTAKIGSGQSATLAATLPAGKYVFVCNLGFGSQSHAGKGQHADVTVS